MTVTVLNPYEPIAPLTLTIEQAAQLLGVSPSTVRNRVTDGTIRAVKLGRLIRIPRAELERLIEPEVE